MKKKLIHILLLMAMFFAFPEANAQAQRCGIVNTAFAPGERIEYNIFFRMGFIRTQAGRGSITIEESTFRGQPAYRAQMIMGTTGAIGAIQSFSETSTSFLDKSLRPLLYTSETHERIHTVDRQEFTHIGDQVNIRSVRYRNDVQRFDTLFTANTCTFDYFSILLFVRNLDFENMNVGDRQHVQFLTGRRLVDMYITFLGTSTVRVGRNRHEVYNVSMTVFNDTFTNPTEAISASLSRDANRIPIIINTDLRVGSIRAEMRSASGLRH